MSLEIDITELGQDRDQRFPRADSAMILSSLPEQVAVTAEEIALLRALLAMEIGEILNAELSQAHANPHQHAEQK